MVPEFSSGRNNAIFKELLGLPVKELCLHQLWLQNFNLTQVFCWGILAKCCSEISIPKGTESLDWIKYSPIITQLCLVFKTYCLKQRPKNPFICDDFPKEVSIHSSTDLQM